MTWASYGVKSSENPLLVPNFVLPNNDKKGLYYWPFVRGIHWWLVNSPCKAPIKQCFLTMTSSCSYRWLLLVIFEVVPYQFVLVELAVSGGKQNKYHMSTTTGFDVNLIAIYGFHFNSVEQRFWTLLHISTSIQPLMYYTSCSNVLMTPKPAVQRK